MAQITLIRVGIGVCVAALALAAGLGHVLAAGRGAPTIAADPAPALFTPSAYASLAAAVRSAEARADTRFAGWIAANPGRHDGRFARWAVRAMGAPRAAPGEIALLTRLDRARTGEQSRAALWLESHGKKELWFLFVGQFRDLYGAPRGRTLKRAAKRSYKLAGALASTAKASYRRPSPYEVAPALRALNKARFAGTVRYSYPSKHAVIASAETTVLDAAEPGRAREIDAWKDQIDYSRLVGGGHYPSDVSAGAYLGRLIGDYELYLERIGR